MVGSFLFFLNYFFINGMLVVGFSVALNDPAKPVNIDMK